MTSAFPPGPFTLALHPDAKGLGWIAFANPAAPYRWGVVAATRDKNVRCRKHVEKLLDQLPTETIVLETYERSGSTRGERIAWLCRSIVALAQERGIEVAIYSRKEVGECFSTVGARTRHQIAETVAEHIPELRHKLPRRRRAWDGEDRRMALFSASALAVTHFRRQAQLFLEDVGTAA